MLYYIVIFLIFAPGYCMAKTAVVISQKLKERDVKSAKIIYTGDITDNKIAEMMASIDDVNANYPAVKEIALYINSFGGDMEAGYMGAQAVKGSVIPVKTINAAMTGSAATIIYCSGIRRETLPGATFLIHPAASQNMQKNYLKKNEILLLNRDIENSSKMFTETYASCFKNHEKEIDNALLSEDNRIYLRLPESIKYGIAQKQVDGILPADIAFYISSSETGS